MRVGVVIVEYMGACNGDVTLAPGVGRRGARTRRCSRAAAAVQRGFAGQITKKNMASKKAALGESLTTGRHKDICGVLRKRRDVVKDGVAPDSCTAELVAFLQR